MVQITVTPERAAMTDDQPRSPDALLNAVLAYRPGLMLDVQPRYVTGGSADGGGAFALTNLADTTRLVPAGNLKPVLVNSNKDLQFGLDTPLVHEAERQHDMTGQYSIAWVSRLADGQGGPIVGNRLGTATSSWVGFDITSSILVVYHAGVLRAAFDTPQDDGLVHSYIVSVKPSGEVAFYIDGTYIGSQIAAITAWGVNGQLMVGGYGDDAADGFLNGGRRRAAVVIPGRALKEAANADELAAVKAWLAAVKAR